MRFACPALQLQLQLQAPSNQDPVRVQPEPEPELPRRLPRVRGGDSFVRVARTDESWLTGQSGSQPGSMAASCIVRTNTVAFSTGPAPVHSLLPLAMHATALNYYVERSDYESYGGCASGASESEASPGCLSSSASSRAGSPPPLAAFYRKVRN
ncbi:hypothetical protein ACLKA6_012406 [Drosophila palustris]